MGSLHPLRFIEMLICVVILLTTGKKCNGIIFINFGVVRERIEVSCKLNIYLNIFQYQKIAKEIRTFSLPTFLYKCLKECFFY